MGTACALGVFPLLYILNFPLGDSGNLFDSRSSQSATELALGIIVSFCGGILANTTGPNIRAVLLNVNTPETRGTAFSIYNLMDDLGKGFGPLIVAILIEEVGRTSALNISVIFWFISGTIIASMAFTIQNDLGSMEKQLIQATVNTNTVGASMMTEVDKSKLLTGTRTLSDDNDIDVEMAQDKALLPVVSDEYKNRKRIE